MKLYGLTWDDDAIDGVHFGQRFKRGEGYNKIFSIWDKYELGTDQILVGFEPDREHCFCLARGLEPYQIAERFRLGTHNQMTDKLAKRCARNFKRLYKRYPYRVYFADQAGMKVKFLDPITIEDADWIEKNVYNSDEIYNLREDENWRPAPHFVREQGLQVWFD
ncbi:MAG: hypothetical protein ACKVT0_23275 [Planctomycetaceae bacterium]